MIFPTSKYSENSCSFLRISSSFICSSPYEGITCLETTYQRLSLIVHPEEKHEFVQVLLLPALFPSVLCHLINQLTLDVLLSQSVHSPLKYALIPLKYSSFFLLLLILGFLFFHLML